MFLVGGARVWGGVRPRQSPRAAGAEPACGAAGVAEAVPACGAARATEASPTASSRALAMLTRCAPATIAAGVAMMPSPEQYVTERSG